MCALPSNVVYEAVQLNGVYLQVQSNHFTDFLSPELQKAGYSAIYKKKTTEIFTGNSYAIDGCATFFRRDRFSLVKKYEVSLAWAHSVEGLAAAAAAAYGSSHCSSARQGHCKPLLAPSSASCRAWGGWQCSVQLLG